MMQTLILVLSICSELLLAVGMYRFFKKAGEKSYLAFIPFINAITMHRIMGKPFYHFFLQLIPILNVYYYAADIIDFLSCFGISSYKQRVYALAFGPFYFIKKSFRALPEYRGPSTYVHASIKQVFLVLLPAMAFWILPAVLLRAFVFESFSIPTPSCANTLRVGDIVIVSKLHYGPRTCALPLQIPLTHQRIKALDIPSYSNAIELPYFRLPGFSEIKRNDMVVFNWPADEEYPRDMKTFYIKRCVALAGDTLQIIDTEVLVNGKPAQQPAEVQFQYYLITQENLNERLFEEHGITDYYQIPEGFIVHTKPSTAKKLEKLPFIQHVIMNKQQKGVGEPQVFPYHSKWNVDFYGPLWIPQKGATLQMTSENVLVYWSTIAQYEGLENVKKEADKLWIEGKPVDSYTFRQNYYFMMGDSRHNSLDSRFWGFVPEDHIEGKGVYVYHESGGGEDIK